MSQTFTNLDAQFLFDFAEDREYDGVHNVRFVLIAQHLQSMDEKLQNLAAARSYSDGVRDERLRILGRSNLPLQSSEISPELSMELARRATTVKPRRAVRPEAPVRKVGLSSDLLRGLKIDLTQLGVKL